MCQEQNEEENLPVLSTALMHQYRDLLNTREKIIRASSNINGKPIPKTRTKTVEEKSLYGYFKQQSQEITHKIYWHGADGETYRETEPPLIAALNNAIWSNCIKAKIDSSQQNSFWILYWKFWKA